MSPSIRIAILLIVLTTSSLVLVTAAGVTQDKKPPAEFVERPAPPVSEETKKEMEARIGEDRRRFEAQKNDP
jgi:hypothetical protein